ncbi:MAG: nitrile hydratase subunit beta [Cyanobacteria bacterium P01_G01_bin.54]
MKLQHNLGGLQGLGPINFEKRVFVEAWETRIFGIHTAMMALSNHLSQSLPDYEIENVPTQFKSFWTWGHLRMGAEAMHPFEYFRLRYYEKWLGGISGFFVSEGYITQAELDTRIAEILDDPAKAEASLPSGGEEAVDAQVEKYLREGDSPMRSPTVEPKFKVGDTVRIKDVPPSDHTRLPGHLRNRIGTVDLVYDNVYTYFFPTDDGIGVPMPIYSLCFQPDALWNESLLDAKAIYYNDIFEIYIEAA